MTLEAIASDLAKLGAAHAAAATQVEREAVGVLRAVLQKAMPALSRKEPLGEIEALVAECLREAIEEPRIVVRVADQLFEAVQRRLAPLAAAAGYAGKFVLLADDALGLGDCRVEWADGGAERDQKRLLNDLDAAFVRALATLDAAAPTFAQETTHE
jgi:flagellar assembly protein FliH